MSDVDVALARAEERDLIANLFQLYTHDFSEFWADRPEGELGDDGRFADYPYLADYWREPDRIPLIFRIAGRPVGFALINSHSHSGLPVDHNVAEFFVVRKHRRGGTGAAAARAVFSRYPGVWEAAVVRKNTGALSFWRKAVVGHAAVSEIEENDYRTDHWNGPIIRFRIG